MWQSYFFFNFMWVRGHFLSTCLPGQAAYQDKLFKKKNSFFFFSESPVRTQIFGYTDIGYKYKFDLKWNCYPSSKPQILH